MQFTRGAEVLCAVIIVIAAGCLSEVSYSPGPIAPNNPIQTKITSAPIFQKAGYIVRPLARFEIEARVLSRERYRFDRGASLSPVDLALGWGPMSDQAVLDQIDISQGGRFYRWRVERYPIPRRAIIEHSANMHMIPADDVVERDLLNVREGEVVRIEGYLVKASSEKGGSWTSSLTRKDSGDGACELVWVENVLSYTPDMAEADYYGE